MKYIGFVDDIRRKETKQIVTVVLNYEELETERLILGEFIIVTSSNARKFLARVEDCYYAPVMISKEDKSQALAKGRLNNEIDNSSVKFINFMHYDLVLLGEMDFDKNIFSAGVRDVPSLMDVQVYRPKKQELQQIVEATVPGTTGQNKTFRLGRLQYGTRQTADGKPFLPNFEVAINYNVKNLHPKRTAVFGKTGYGKSNLIKTLIALTHRYNPGTTQLVFDVNGEYGFSNKQGPGLIDILKDAGNTDGIVVYSNREDARKRYGCQRVKPIKFDVIESPEIAVALVVGKRKQRERGDADYLDELTDSDMHATARSFWRCFCVVELGLKAAPYHKAKYKTPAKHKKEDENAPEFIDDFELAHELILKHSDSNTVKHLKGKTGQFAFLKRFHYLSGLEDSDQDRVNFFDEIKKDIAGRKIIILDLPSISSNLLTPLSDKLAGDIFNQAQDMFLVSSVDEAAEGSNSNPILMYVEEAHNVLSDRQNTVFPRIAREGRKYGIGLVYSTQRPGSIDEDILTQTENFFVMHLGSMEDTTSLSKSKIAYSSPISDFILTEPAVGIAYVYSEPYQPYVLSCKVRKFEDVWKDDK